MKISKDLYLSYVRKALAEEGIRTADIFNKMALETNAIDTDPYLEAARIIVRAYTGQIK